MVVKDGGIIMDNNGLEEVTLVAFDGGFNGGGGGRGGGRKEGYPPSICPAPVSG